MSRYAAFTKRPQPCAGPWQRVIEGPVSGKVEIAYFTFPEFERRGLATSMARELVILAKATEPGIIVTAQTLPQRNASTRILEKLGFAQMRTVVDPEVGEVWEWELSQQGA